MKDIKWSCCAIIFLFSLKVCLGQRRIVKGTRTHAHKRYMVYLVQARQNSVPEDSWLCGGALVSPSQILTSAACIVEMEDIYAIAGYLKYVNGMDIDQDDCTKITKRKVIKIRIPRDYLQDFSNTTQWMSIDIGVATVESPYDFEDISFRIYCSYIPAPIQINYNPAVDRAETNVVALGWGRDRGQKPDDVTDRNSKNLQEASLKIKEKKHCIKHFVGPNFAETIDKYMICVHGKGVLDAEGLVLEDNLRHGNKCADFLDLFENKTNYFTRQGLECTEDDFGLSFRRLINDTSETNMSNNSQTAFKDSTRGFNQSYSHGAIKLKTNNSNSGRRQGICQNDHGGPLITWVGTTEMLIGVAVNSLYNANYECIGPYLFTSTAAVGSIIKCLLMSKDFTRRECTKSAERMGYSIVERAVYWQRSDDAEPSKQPTELAVKEIDVSGISGSKVSNADYVSEIAVIEITSFPRLMNAGNNSQHSFFASSNEHIVDTKDIISI